MLVYESQVVSVAVSADADAAYRFAREMENLPRWASGLASGIERSGADWFAQSPMGRVQVSMAPDNEFGVLDHVVTLPSGAAFYNALRVTPNAQGCVFSFVVLRTPGVDAAAFLADIAHVEQDLQALKRLLESPEAAAQPGDKEGR